MIKGIYIDDDEDQRKTYSELLSSENFNFFEQVLPKSITHLISKVQAYEPSIIVMDYRLDGSRTEGWDNNFKAGGVAQVLREYLIDSPKSDVPILLLSTEQNIQQLFSPDRTSHDLFDLWFLKDELHLGDQSRRDEILSKMLALSLGYETIKSIVAKGLPQELSQDLLGLGSEEYDEINTEGLKLTLLSAEGEAERPHVIARQLYHNIVKRPGLLLSQYGLSARFGIQPTSLPALVKAAELDGLIYDGLFSTGWERYWRHRFDRWEVANFDKLITSMTGDKRAQALSKKFEIEIFPAVSKWTGMSNEHFSFACCVCRNPTEMRHSVAAFEPKLLPFMERNRICYDCVEREEQMRRQRIQVAEADEGIVADIRSELIQRPPNPTQPND